MKTINWKTRFFNEQEMEVDGEVILAAGKLIDGIDTLLDESMWKIIQDGVAYVPSFADEYGVGVSHEENITEFIYTLWLKGILQYVGVTHVFGRRFWQHGSGAGKNDVNRDVQKIFDTIRYTKCPVPNKMPLREDVTGKQTGLIYIIEKEMVSRFGLNRDVNGMVRGIEQNWKTPDKKSMYIRTENFYSGPSNGSLSEYYDKG